MKKYWYWTRKIKDEKSKADFERSDKEIEQMLIKRALVIKKAEVKSFAFDIIMQKLKIRNFINHIVVFIEDEEQCREIQHVLEKYNLKYAIYDANTSQRDRVTIIEDFEKERIDVVITKRCWDQGIDIPSLRIGILISSTNVERQLIQRIGRLLRPYPGKKEVYVYDLLVFKSLENVNEGGFDKTIFLSERIRMDFLSKNSKNG
jgi:superfamily II DNA or RNA helicase